MVMCVETPYYELGWAGLQVEDMIVVRSDGIEIADDQRRRPEGNAMTVTPIFTRALLREDLANASGSDVRAAARIGQWRRATHGLARGYRSGQHGHRARALRFRFPAFCQRNPKPCPVIDVTDPGDPEARACRARQRHRTTCRATASFATASSSPRYAEITGYWRADSVAFLLGCSNSMDEVLLGAGIPQRHLESEDGRISVYISNIQCAPGRHIPRAGGRDDAADPAGPPRRRDRDLARYPHGARRAGACRRPARDRHRGSEPCRLGQIQSTLPRRRAGVLGLRRDPAGDRHGKRASPR